jgi:hypothetical protein
MRVIVHGGAATVHLYRFIEIGLNCSTERDIVLYKEIGMQGTPSFGSKACCPSRENGIL